MINILKSRDPIRYGMICLSLSAPLLVSGCVIPIVTSTGGVSAVGTSSAEVELRERSTAMQKTIVEAIAVGALAGLAIGLLDRDASGNPFGGGGVGGYLLGGALAGAVAGTYVGFLQRDFANEEERLERARADIRANNAETLATLQVMQSVLNRQVSELNRLRAAVDAGTADSARLNTEIQEARANLREMERATNGAEKRHREFSKARRVVAVDRGDNNIDAELAELSTRITQMRQVADDLADEL